MMVFMGFMFYKVPAGLCIYFIASSLWGIIERKVVPPVAKPGAATPADLAGLLAKKADREQRRTQLKKKQR